MRAFSPTTLIALSCCLVIATSAPVHADNAPTTNAKSFNASDKLVRGLVNIVTAPWEIPHRLRKRTKDDNTVRGWSVGTAQGLGYATTRLLVGTFEVLTFPLRGKRQYAPVMKPEYVWDDTVSRPE